MPAKRYYAQHKQLDDVFWLPAQHEGWQVFDRQMNIHGQDDDPAIAFCRNRHYAFAIRDALNMKEDHGPK